MMTKKENKKYSWENSKIAIYFLLGLYKGCPSYRKSLQPSNENIHDFSCFHFFFGHFSPPGF
jgi:hypothetical protein